MNEKKNNLNLFTQKMVQANLPESVIETFKYYYIQLLNGSTGYIYENEIKPVTSGFLPKSEDITEYGALGRENFHKVVHIVLNGGLGTSMGLLGPKSLLKVKNGLSFLEIILCLAQQKGINLAFMNSFNTEKQTVEALAKLPKTVQPFHFTQNRFPKVAQSNLKPVSYPKNPNLEWNPPGHGDIYVSLYASGILDKLLLQGIKYAFISNIDNLRAYVISDILGYFVAHNLPFMMEVAAKTTSDVKGGHLAQSVKNKNLVLRELAQCPPQNHNDFLNLDKYPLFNTNNVWVNLEFLRDYIVKHKFVPLPIIINSKTVDYRDADSPKIYQIESAMGAAINIFKEATAILVPRSRLLAVKTCNDLLAIRSDCYKMSANNEIYMAPERVDNFAGRRPKIDLDQRYFSKIDEFEKRFAEIPSLLNCESLTITGDFYFEMDVSIYGNVNLVNTTNMPITVKKGTKLKGEIIY